MNKKLRYLIEAALLYILFSLCYLLPQRTASNLGGWIGRHLGIKMAATRKARRNIKMAFPKKTDQEVEDIVIGMWDNLGRVMLEYPHLKDMIKNNSVTIHNLKALKDAEKLGKPILFVGAHLGNWEVMPYAINSKIQNKMSLVYRAPNNPWSDMLLSKARKDSGGSQLRKGSKGAKEIVRLIKEGSNVGLLFDQKMNEGLPIPFFGNLAMTITSIAQLGLRYECTILPAYCLRRNQTEFDVHFGNIFELSNTKSLGNDIEQNMRRLNQLLESWIEQKPEQWLWLHRRWPETQDQLKPKKKVA